MKSAYSNSNPLSKSSALSPWTENADAWGLLRGTWERTCWAVVLHWGPQWRPRLSLRSDSRRGCGKPGLCPFLPQVSCPAAPAPAGPLLPSLALSRIVTELLCVQCFSREVGTQTASRGLFPSFLLPASSPIAKQRPLVWEEVISTTFRLSHETPGHLPPTFPFSFFSWLGWKCDGGSYSSSFTPRGQPGVEDESILPTLLDCLPGVRRESAGLWSLC